MLTYTTQSFIDAVKRTSHVPPGNNTFTEADFLALGDTEMRTRIAPKIASCRENYWLTRQTYQPNDQNAYPIPSLAQGGAFVDVKVNVSGNLISLSRVEVSELYSLNFATRPAYSYYLEDNLIKTLSVVNLGPILVWYYRLASKLVPVSECAQITAISGNDITVDAVPASFLDQTLDVVSQTPGFNVSIKDETPVTVGDVMTFAEVPSGVAVGDYVCLSGQSCVVQCPIEWIEVLVQATTVRIYQIQGYLNKHKTASEDLDNMVTAAMGLVSPRTIENAKIIQGGGSLIYPMISGWKMPVRGN